MPDYLETWLILPKMLKFCVTSRPYALSRLHTPSMKELGNIQISYDASKGGGAQTVRLPSYGVGGLWLNHHITFIVAEKV